MKYTVKRIDEDIDFGCDALACRETVQWTVSSQERSADAPVMAVVTLIDEAGQEVKMRQPDQMLYDWDINEGDEVILNEKNELQKTLSGDWTKDCTTKTVDTTKFVEMMQAVKSGKKIDWACPFCGGKVGLMEQDGGHTMIGCDSCDMRINLDEN